MSDNTPVTGKPKKPGTRKPGARKATTSTRDNTAPNNTHTTGTSATRTRHRTPTKHTLLAITAILAVALTATLTLTLRDPNDLGPLDHTINGDPTIPTADRILIDQDHNGTPDTVLDLNHNNRADKGEPSLADLAHQRTTIATKIAANPNSVHESLITPPGNNWWTFTTSQAADLRLWETPAPTHATWYGLTTGRALHPEYPTPTYHAIHIGFPTTDQATDYMNTVGIATGPRIRAALRGTIVTLTAPHIDPYAEPFPKTGKTLDATNNSLHPAAAAWTLNLGQQHTDLADSAAKKTWAASITDYYRHQGFTATTIWNGVAATPQGPWVGTLTNYQPDNINLTAAAQAISGTQKFKCTSDGSACQDVGPSLTGLAFYSSAATPTQVIGGIDLTNLDAEPAYAPTGTTLAFTANNTAIRGVIDGTLTVPVGPYTLIHGDITTGVRNQNILTLTFAEAEHPTQIATDAPQPNTPTPPTTGDKGSKGNKENKGNKGNPPTPEQPQPGDPITPTKPPKGTNLPTPTPPTDPTQQQ